MPAFLMTIKQLAILEVVRKGNDDGTFVDMDELLDKLPYKTSKESLQCSIRVLEEHKLVERKPTETRRGRRRRVVAPTMNTYRLLKKEGSDGSVDLGRVGLGSVSV